MKQLLCRLLKVEKINYSSIEKVVQRHLCARSEPRVHLMHYATTLFSNPASFHVENVQINLVCMPANSTSLIQPLGLKCLRHCKVCKINSRLHFRQQIKYLPHD